MQLMRVLVVAPDLTVSRTVAEVLRGESRVGEIEEVRTGKEALGRERAWRPDIVLIDIRLPDINGLDLARRLKTLPSAPYIVLLTLGGGETYQDILRVFGLDAALNKRNFVEEFTTFLDALDQDGRKKRESHASSRAGL